MGTFFENDTHMYIGPTKPIRLVHSIAQPPSLPEIAREIGVH